MEFNPTPATTTENITTENAPVAAATPSGQILVKTLTGEAIPIDYNPNTTIAQIKEHISSHQQVPIDQQRLIYQGKQLEDGNTISDYDIVPGNTIHLVLRVKGGFQ